jgi:hypothetical protein
VKRVALLVGVAGLMGGCGGGKPIDQQRVESLVRRMDPAGFGRSTTATCSGAGERWNCTVTAKGRRAECWLVVNRDRTEGAASCQRGK